jgi:hypothetical protein
VWGAPLSQQRPMSIHLTSPRGPTLAPPPQVQLISMPSTAGRSPPPLRLSCYPPPGVYQETTANDSRVRAIK